MYVKNPVGIIAEFTEIESGKNNNREQLLEAIDVAKKKSARLIIAKLDRLSRNAAFIFTLRDSGVDFVCADMPDANTLTVGIFAVLAQHEHEMISSRTKAALAAKKRQGAKLGKPENLGDKARARSIEVRRRLAETNISNIQVTDIIADKRKQKMSFQQIAEHLNKKGYKTRMGKTYQKATVKMLYDRSISINKT
jgi:DNA invertase Pin-like site-specific DNA recombinase